MDISGATKDGKKAVLSSEDVFKVVSYVLVAILSLCVKRILDFRHFCQSKGIYVFAEDSLMYCGISFLSLFAIKYTYYYFFEGKIDKIVSPKYQGEARQLKIKSVTKLLFDTFFYSLTSCLAYYLFVGEPWFPTMVGGGGKCTALYDHYPDWPVAKRTQLEIFFMIQLGVHVFSVFEMMVIKRKTEKKYYEYLLHHFMAASLIFFSMMCNEITAGTMILIVHDFSDIFIAATRAYFDMDIAKKRYVVVPVVGVTLFAWVYMRIIVFPFCLLANVYINKPTMHDDWYMIYYPYLYLLIMAFVLFGMHIYWTFFIIKSVIKSVNKGETINVHEKPTTKNK